MLKKSEYLLKTSKEIPAHYWKYWPERCTVCDLPHLALLLPHDSYKITEGEPVWYCENCAAMYHVYSNKIYGPALDSPK